MVLRARVSSGMAAVSRANSELDALKIGEPGMKLQSNADEIIRKAAATEAFDSSAANSSGTRRAKKSRGVNFHAPRDE